MEQRSLGRSGLKASTVRFGMLTGKHRRNDLPSAGTRLAQRALNERDFTITGATPASQAQASVAAASWRLDATDMAAVDAITKR